MMMMMLFSLFAVCYRGCCSPMAVYADAHWLQCRVSCRCISSLRLPSQRNAQSHTQLPQLQRTNQADLRRNGQACRTRGQREGERVVSRSHMALSVGELVRAVSWLRRLYDASRTRRCHCCMCALLSVDMCSPCSTSDTGYVMMHGAASCVVVLQRREMYRDEITNDEHIMVGTGCMGGLEIDRKREREREQDNEDGILRRWWIRTRSRQLNIVRPH